MLVYFESNYTDISLVFAFRSPDFGKVQGIPKFYENYRYV